MSDKHYNRVSNINLSNDIDTEGYISLVTTTLSEHHALGSALINEQEAVQLVCHLIKVFQVESSEIEVIHFEKGCSRADVLRKAADRLDAGEVFNGTY